MTVGPRVLALAILLLLPVGYADAQTLQETQELAKCST
jgi:hypothetical protein